MRRVNRMLREQSKKLISHDVIKFGQLTLRKIIKILLLPDLIF